MVETAFQGFEDSSQRECSSGCSVDADGIVPNCSMLHPILSIFLARDRVVTKTPAESDVIDSCRDLDRRLCCVWHSMRKKW